MEGGNGIGGLFERVTQSTIQIGQCAVTLLTRHFQLTECHTVKSLPQFTQRCIAAGPHASNDFRYTAGNLCIEHPAAPEQALECQAAQLGNRRTHGDREHQSG
jgi:hypothetical protein